MNTYSSKSRFTELSKIQEQYSENTTNEQNCRIRTETNWQLQVDMLLMKEKMFEATRSRYLELKNSKKRLKEAQTTVEEVDVIRDRLWKLEVSCHFKRLDAKKELEHEAFMSEIGLY